MTKKEVKILEIASHLSKKNKNELLTWVHLAWFAEQSVRKSLKNIPPGNGSFPLIQQRN